ncbi:alpha/beta fold hydrolase [Vannielia litorea]|uniref:alpha/beta fold hydrolase n=1 Tax=Vannielia litorea TaxID=1217970 RepID=UPI001BCD9C58|nr:alpha/beta fold hydrolase [Vannielia litorea]MBS8227832.1 alpha/beta fold hydrolase [Vannielia litorea]
MDEILATLMALTATEPDGAYFDALLANGQGAQVEVTHCRDPLAMTEIVGETVLCGTVTVPEDHDAPDNGQVVDLAFAILRADTSYPAADPVVYLHGGPGIGAVGGGLGFMADKFGPFRATRDVVLFDQRAAGISSGSVACREQINMNVAGVAMREIIGLDLDADGNPVVTPFLENCLEEIQADGTDLSKYNSRQNALDVPYVLTALGYESWNLYGISYGTKLTMEVMRSAPEGTRAAVIDGVAPPWIKLYDTLGLPMAESMERLVQDCAAEPACAEAYPELGRVLAEVLAKTKAGELVMDGTTIPANFVGGLFNERNTFHHPNSITAYFPAIIYELHRGGEAPTLEMVAGDWGFNRPGQTAADVLAARKDALTETQHKLLGLALKDAEIIAAAESSLGVAVAELRGQLHRDKALGPMPGLFDAELSAALPGRVTTQEEGRALLRDYAALRSGTPSRGRLSDFVRAHFDGPVLARLLAIVDAMTEAEVAAVFAFVAEEVQTHTLEFQQNSIDLMLYACQEDMPFNSREGYDATTAALPYDTSGFYDDSALLVYGTCQAFEPVPREGWHEVVESDIPTVSIGSGWDIQTAASWAEEAVRGLTNAQHFFIAEAGHGALAYADCVGDMTAAFINDPTRQLDDSCEKERAVGPFYIAPWVATEAAE